MGLDQLQSALGTQHLFRLTLGAGQMLLGSLPPSMGPCPCCLWAASPTQCLLRVLCWGLEPRVGQGHPLELFPGTGTWCWAQVRLAELWKKGVGLSLLVHTECSLSKPAGVLWEVLSWLK